MSKEIENERQLIKIMLMRRPKNLKEYFKSCQYIQCREGRKNYFVL
jgi:hypothetical protein